MFSYELEFFPIYNLQGNIQKRHKVNWLDVGLAGQMKILNSG